MVGIVWQMQKAFITLAKVSQLINFNRSYALNCVFSKECLVLVYVLNITGQPLMPTTRHGKVKHLLREGKAKVVKRCPFTIQLLYNNTTYVQPITLGVDAESKHIGLSATTKEKVLYEVDVELRDDIVKLLSTRRQN